MTCDAKEALEASDAIVGYKSYIRAVSELVDGKEVYQFGMRKEIERCQKAIELAVGGKLVTLVSSGDPGVYGMAGLVLELVGEHEDIDIEVIPGVSAVNAAASALGAPLMHDFAVISLSDLLTPWEVIEKRLRASASADFVVALYNPKSSKRKWQIKTARDIFIQFRDVRTPVGLYAREGAEQRYIISDLVSFVELPIDMNTTVIIGNSQTYVRNGKMITPRGYKL
jgi:precorrin-3B C17-methyltransferase